MSLNRTESKRQYRINNREKYLLQARKTKKTPRGRFNKYKYGANRRGYIFELSFETFSNLILQNCYYCGTSESVGVDRKDNSIGYLEDNCVSCCTQCNKSKGTLNFDEYIDLCCKVYINIIKLKH